MAGELLMRTAREHGGEILPVDSEPSAIWQCIQGEDSPVRKLFITASGGAFRDRTWSELADVSPAEALKHPTWDMGAKITIDSATLMNKAFEVIEARWLFDVPFEKIEAVIHRQSIVHSMVEFEDGSIKAQLGRARHAPADSIRHVLPRAKAERFASEVRPRGRGIADVRERWTRRCTRASKLRSVTAGAVGRGLRR